MSPADINIAPVQPAPSGAPTITGAQPGDAAAAGSTGKTFASILQAVQQASAPVPTRGAVPDVAAMSASPQTPIGAAAKPAAFNSTPATARLPLFGKVPLDDAGLTNSQKTEAQPLSKASTDALKDIKVEVEPASAGKQDIRDTASPPLVGDQGPATKPGRSSNVKCQLHLLVTQSSEIGGKAENLQPGKLEPHTLEPVKSQTEEVPSSKLGLDELQADGTSPVPHPEISGVPLPPAAAKGKIDPGVSPVKVPVETASGGKEIAAGILPHASAVFKGTALSRTKVQPVKNEIPLSTGAAAGTNAFVVAPQGIPSVAEVGVQAGTIPPVALATIQDAQTLPREKQTAAPVKTASLQAAATQALPGVTPASKQTESIANKQPEAFSGQPQPFVGQAAHGSSQEDTREPLGKADAHTGKFSEALAEIQAQSTTGFHGEGASFSLSLAHPVARDAGVTTIASSTGSVPRAADSTGTLPGATQTSSPVKRLDVAVQDPVLGAIDVHAEMRSGVLHASLSGTEEAIGASLSSLHHYLRDQQVAVSSLTFNSPAERVNGPAHASGASEFMRQTGQGAGSESSFSADRQGRGEPQERKEPMAAANQGPVQTNRGSLTNALPQRQASIMPAGSTLSIHI